MTANNLLIILGPTAIGKTKLAVKLAKKFAGEIISADSRQVYQGMDIITGKDLPVSLKLKYNLQQELNTKIKLGAYIIQGIAVWGLDLVKPDQEFSVNHWLRFVKPLLLDIWQKGKLPIIVAGNGFWLKALLEGVDSLGVPPDWKLRKKLEKLEIKQLRQELDKIWPERLAKMNESDLENPRRLIRAIEIKYQTQNSNVKTQNYNSKLKTNKLFMIGLSADNKTIYERIDKRVLSRVNQGAEKEVRKLLAHGYSWNLQSMTALGYQEWKPYIEGKAALGQVIKSWQFEEHAYARRQLTWFKKFLQIKWFDIKQKNWQKRIALLIKSWYDENNG